MTNTRLTKALFVLTIAIMMSLPIGTAWDASKYTLNSSAPKIGSAKIGSSSFLQRFTYMGGKACSPLKEVKCENGYLIRKTVSGGCQAQPTCCGNSQCETGESPSNCPRDCFQPAQSKEQCKKVEPPSCKGRYIYQSQVKGGCALPPTCCGDGVCQDNEGEASCPEDCAKAKQTTVKSYCPKYPFPHCTGVYVYPPKDKFSCTGQPTCCGNKVCDSPVETGLNCPGDCGKGVIMGTSYKPFSVKAGETFREIRTDSRVLTPTSS